MKRILCYGDSNTRGQSGHETRIDDIKQWPHILHARLGDGYYVVQEGLSGRVAGDFDTEKPYLNGKSSFEVIYRSAAPLDLVMISLGTNDLKRRYARTAHDIVSDLRWYQNACQEYADINEERQAKVMYVCPANFTADIEYFDALESLRQEIITEMHHLDAPVVELPELGLSEDGVHYSEQDHQQVAVLLAQKAKEILV